MCVISFASVFVTSFSKAHASVSDVKVNYLHELQSELICFFLKFCFQLIYQSGHSFFVSGPWTLYLGVHC